MKIFPKTTDFIYDGAPLISNNNLYFKPMHKSDTTIPFGDYSLGLNVDCERKTLVSLEGIFEKRNVIEKEFEIPIAEKAELYFDEIERFGEWKKYYDKKSGWFCFGSIGQTGDAYYFASDTIAIIKNNELQSLYVKPTIVD